MMSIKKNKNVKKIQEPKMPPYPSMARNLNRFMCVLCLRACVRACVFLCVYLLMCLEKQVNASPSFSAENPADHALKTELIKDVLDVIDLEERLPEGTQK